MRQLKKMWLDDEAVSPVIAVILMVAITVVLAAVLYIWAQSFVVQDKDTPRGAMSSQEVKGNFQIKVTTMAPAVAGGDIKFILIRTDTGAPVVDETGRTIQGELNDIYNVKLRNPVDGSVMTLKDNNGDEYKNYITWMDSNQDNKLTSGDQIIILGRDNTTFGSNSNVEPGIGTDAMTLMIKFDPTNNVITRVALE